MTIDSNQFRKLTTPLIQEDNAERFMQGPAGPGVAAGGTAGQVLAKIDATDYNTQWVDNTATLNPTDVKAIYTQVHNAQGAILLKGQAVYLYQATGDNPSVKLANNTGDATSAKTLGLVYATIS